MTTKHKIEEIFRKADIVPEARKTIDGTEIFIGDGFSAPPHIKYTRFGVEPTEFPYGMYVSFWWASKGEDKLDVGRPLFFDAIKSDSRDKHARVNAAFKDAKQFLKDRKKVRANAS